MCKATTTSLLVLGRKRQEDKVVPIEVPMPKSAEGGAKTASDDTSSFHPPLARSSPQSGGRKQARCWLHHIYLWQKAKKYKWHFCLRCNPRWEMFLSIQLLKIVIFKELYKYVTHSKTFSRNHELETYFQFCENAKSRKAKKKTKKQLCYHETSEWSIL